MAATDDRHEHLAFGTFLLPLIALVPIRWAIAVAVGVPDQKSDLACYALVGACFMMISVLFSSRGYARCSVVMKALTLMLFGTAYGIDLMLAFLHLGRHVPYRDALLASWDAAIGFDWTSYAKFLDSSPVAWTLSKYAYMFIAPQPFIALLVLSGQPARLYAYVAATVLAVTACCVIVPFAPALGAYVHFDAVSAGFRHRDFAMADGMSASLEWIRGEHPVGLVKNIALISFPSFHTVSAILGAWAFWKVRGVRWVVLALDAAMLASTPVQGSHYMVDLLGGAAVAILTIAAVEAVLGKALAEPARSPNLAIGGVVPA